MLSFRAITCLLAGLATASAPVGVQANEEGAALNHATPVYDIRAYGAAGDGAQLETAAIQRAIDACNAAGGGRVVVSPGTYRSGAIRLRGGVTLDVQAGARIQGSDALDDYRFEDELVGLISARDSEDIWIVGSGTIDGAGDAFADWASLEPGGSAEERADGPVVMGPRPGNLVVFANCRNVGMRDVTIANAPFWTVHLDGCTDARLLDLRIRNNPLIPNNDGIHCTTSSHVQIRGCDIAAGDDAIAITGINDHGPIIPGFIGYERPAENVVVTDCILESRSVAVRVGYGHNDVRHCLFANLLIRNALRGVGVFTRNAGSISDVVFSNIVIETRLYDGFWWGWGEAIHVSTQRQFEGEPVGRIERVVFRDVRAAGPNGALLYGMEDAPLRDISLENVSLRMVPDPLFDARGETIDVRPAIGPDGGLFPCAPGAIRCMNVADLKLRDVQVAFGGDTPLRDADPVRVTDFSDLLVDGLNCPDAAGAWLRLIDGDGAGVRRVGFEDAPDARIAIEGVSRLNGNRLP